MIRSATISSTATRPFAFVLPSTHKTIRKLAPTSLNFRCSSSYHSQIPKLSSSPNAANTPVKPNTHLLKTVTVVPNEVPLRSSNKKEKRGCKSSDSGVVGGKQMMVLCGFGYWMQGIRCFPWLALNFHMAYFMKMSPSMLQLVQNFGSLPMVAKPLYGVMSDALYIGSAHRVPYISIGVVLQILSWGLMAFIPVAGEGLPTLLACILVSSLGASIAEVAKDALTAEYGKKHKVSGLHSYSFMAQTAGGIIGNLFGGYFLLKIQQPKSMFLIFSLLLTFQLAVSLSTREDSLGLPSPSKHLMRKPILEILGEHFSSMITAVSKQRILFPLCWIAASIAFVPILSGAIFCYQTQFLNLDASVIGMSRVIGQLMLLLATVIYEHYWKTIPMSKLIGTAQIMYAVSLLLDLILVKQINLRLGVSNEAFTLCLSSLAETISQFKLLPFSVLFASLCPPGCEGSLTSFLASALCLSYIISGLLGVGLASLIGISYGEYSNLPLGIMVQFLAALVPLGWISFLPMHQLGQEEQKKRKRSKRSQNMKLKDLRS